MNDRERSALDYFPEEMTLPDLKAAASGCKGCDIYKNATQTVFGEGKSKAQLMFVGEQPGDEEGLGGTSLCGAGRTPF